MRLRRFPRTPFPTNPDNRFYITAVHAYQPHEQAPLDVTVNLVATGPVDLTLLYLQQAAGHTVTLR